MNTTDWFVDASRHKQGILGELTAQLVLTHMGYEVAKPNGIHLPYDLLAELNGQVYRVQVKTTNRIVGGSEEAPRYEVFIATSGGNTRKNNTKAFDPSLIDYMFVMTGNGSCWLIPATAINVKTQLYVGTDKYAEYQVQQIQITVP